jgi:class 3 adenylate cyclase
MPSTRRLAAILVADVAGYSRLMGADEEGTHERLRRHLRDLIDPKIKEHRGRVVKNTGDGMIAEFSSVVDAVRCGVEMQRAMADRNMEVPDDRRIAFRVGINLGDVIAEEEDIYGDGVNVAARLEALAEPGGICISRVVRDQIQDKLFYPFEDQGEQTVKNIARSVRVFALRPEAVADLPLITMLPSTRRWPRRWPILVIRRRHILAMAALAVGLGIVLIAFAWWYWRGPSKEQIALWDAVIEGNVAQAVLAVKAGADVNGLDTRPVAESDGMRPLNWAASRNDVAMIKALLDLGANINAVNLSGFTPAHHAAEANALEAAVLLAVNDANLKLKNKWGDTPEQTARSLHNTAVAEIFADARRSSETLDSVKSNRSPRSRGQR